MFLGVLLTAAGIAGFEVGNVADHTNFETPIEDLQTLPARMEIDRPSVHSALTGMYLPSRDRWYEPRARSCGDGSLCHGELVAQHDISAHGRAMTNETFKAQLAEFIRIEGREAADYCLACHAPLGVIYFPGDGSRGPVIDPLTTTEPAFTMGVSCVACHRAEPERDPSRIGNASLAIRPLWLEPDRYLGEESPDGNRLHNTLIIAANSVHRRTYRVPKPDWNAICGACHLVTLPSSLAHDGVQRIAADHFQSFMDSPFATAGVTCADCHQQRFTTRLNAYNTVDHHYLGTGASLPYVPGDVFPTRESVGILAFLGESHAADGTVPQDPDPRVKARAFRKLTDGFLNGIGDVSLEAATPDELPVCLDTLAAKAGRYVVLDERAPDTDWSTNGGLSHVDLLTTTVRVDATSAGAIDLTVRTVNNCIGHTFPSGGGIKGYLTVEVLDGRGTVLARHGGSGPDGLPVEASTLLGTRTTDKDGQPIRNRRFWNVDRVVYQRVLVPGVESVDAIHLTLPDGAVPARVTAEWMYLRPEFFRNRERGVGDPVPPIRIGRDETDVPHRGVPSPRVP
jgi:hypothetical protein